jgi:hypothetical protein
MNGGMGVIGLTNGEKTASSIWTPRNGPKPQLPPQNFIQPPTATCRFQIKNTIKDTFFQSIEDAF